MAETAAFKSRPVDKMVVSTRVSGWSLPCLVLLLHLEISGAGTQESGFQLWQPQGAVSVAAGETLTLNCSQSGDAPVGPTKWFKDSGSGRQLVYEQRGSFPRVSLAVPGSGTDFTIRINDTRPEDAGTYRCVKFRKKGTGADEEFRSGPGTNVSVSEARAQELQVLQPQDAVSVPAGMTLTLTCSVSAVTPVGPVKWFKGSGSNRQLIYADTGSLPQVTRALPDSDTDFTIQVHNTCPVDAGVYHCVKFQKGIADEKEIRSGPGTNVSVNCQSVFASPGLWIGIFLEKVLTGAFLLFLFQRSKG